jgi:hypothetical protein
MDILKKYLGFVWFGLGPVLLLLMFVRAFQEIGAVNAKIAAGTVAATASQELYLFWIIIILIFIPISIGFTLFGYYALRNEYARTRLTT